MPKDTDNTFIHPTAIVEDGAKIGAGSKIWHFAHIRSGSVLGSECIIGKGVYVDSGVTVGDHCKIQNNVSIYRGVILAEGVFVGPHVCFTNDLNPRAISPDGTLRGDSDWTVTKTVVGKGASIGANSTMVCGIELGDWCMIGAGSVVTRAVPPYALVYGIPARVHGVVAPSGVVVSKKYQAGTYQSKDSGQPVEIRPEWVTRK